MIKDNKKVAWTLYFLTGKHDGDAHVVAQVAQLYQTAICEGDYMVGLPPKNWTLNINHLGVQNDQTIHSLH